MHIKIKHCLKHISDIFDMIKLNKLEYLLRMFETTVSELRTRMVYSFSTWITSSRIYWNVLK